jgi:hypothetical protein
MRGSGNNDRVFSTETSKLEDGFDSGQESSAVEPGESTGIGA